MGYNTTLVIDCNGLSEIAGDAAFGRKLADAITSVDLYPAPSSERIVTAGAFGAAAYVVETHHADCTAVVSVHGRVPVFHCVAHGWRHNDLPTQEKLHARWSELLRRPPTDEDLPTSVVAPAWAPDSQGNAADLVATVVVYNDALHEIAADPLFGKNLADAVAYVVAIGPHSHTAQRQDVPAGCHANAVRVFDVHHCTDTVLCTVGGNLGTVQFSIGKIIPTDPSGLGYLLDVWRSCISRAKMKARQLQQPGLVRSRT